MSKKVLGTLVISLFLATACDSFRFGWDEDNLDGASPEGTGNNDVRMTVTNPGETKTIIACSNGNKVTCRRAAEGAQKEFEFFVVRCSSDEGIGRLDFNVGENRNDATVVPTGVRITTDLEVYGGLRRENDSVYDCSIDYEVRNGNLKGNLTCPKLLSEDSSAHAIISGSFNCSLTEG